MLLLSELFDMMPVHRLQLALDELRASDTTVLLSTKRPEAIARDGWLYLGSQHQQRFDSHDELMRFLAEQEHHDA